MCVCNYTTYYYVYMHYAPPQQGLHSIPYIQHILHAPSPKPHLPLVLLWQQQVVQQPLLWPPQV